MADELLGPNPMVDSNPKIEANSSEVVNSQLDWNEEIAEMRRSFAEKLVQANLRTEAVRAGMIDLDGLKLIDQKSIKFDADGNIEDGKMLMAGLRLKKPWLFNTMSSSSTSSPPASAPTRQKMAMDMSDDEYASARSALVRHSH